MNNFTTVQELSWTPQNTQRQQNVYKDQGHHQMFLASHTLCWIVQNPIKFCEDASFSPGNSEILILLYSSLFLVELLSAVPASVHPQINFKRNAFKPLLSLSS